MPFAAFAPADQTLLRELYQMLTVVWAQLRVTEPTPGRVLHAIRAVVWRSGWYGVLQALPQLGVATAAAPHAAQLDGVLAVVRAGNLAVLHGTLPLLGVVPVTLGTMTALVRVVRDHLTTLRSAIPDLDPAAAAADQIPQPQALDRLVAKWRSPPYGVGQTVSDVRLAVEVAGMVAAHPRERAAVDTVLTTLITQAVLEAKDGIVYVVLLPHGDQDVRLVVYHRTPAPAVVPTDQGHGWAVCAAYVADCYGVPTVQQCLHAQYLAAQVIDVYHVAWFHWPLVPALAAP